MNSDFRGSLQSWASQRLQGDQAQMTPRTWATKGKASRDGVSLRGLILGCKIGDGQPAFLAGVWLG